MEYILFLKYFLWYFFLSIYLSIFGWYLNCENFRWYLNAPYTVIPTIPGHPRPLMKKAKYPFWECTPCLNKFSLVQHRLFVGMLSDLFSVAHCFFIVLSWSCFCQSLFFKLWTVLAVTFKSLDQKVPSKRVDIKRWFEKLSALGFKTWSSL